MDSMMMPSPGSGRGLQIRLKSAASALCARSTKHQYHRHQSHHTYPKISAPAARHHLMHKFRTPPSPSIPHIFGSPTSPDVVVSCSVTNDDEDSNVVGDANAARKIVGKISREALAAWNSRVGPPNFRAPADVVKLLFNDLHLYPSKSQVFEMLVCARKCAPRTELSLSFGEFCVFAAELKRRVKCRTLASKSKNNSSTPTACNRDVSSEFSENLVESKSNLSNERVKAQNSTAYEVFLGGSCNPTTWRLDVAIPALEKMGITYFNPQVAEWSNELIEVEHNAKQSATVLFFVLDAETRAAAASVEAAYLAASTQSRHLILVLQPYSRGQCIAGEIVPDQEYLDLSCGQAILQEVAEKRDLLVFSELESALRCTQLLLRGGDATLSPNSSENASAIAKHLLMLKQAFDSVDEKGTGTLSLNETIKAVKSLTNIRTSDIDLESIVTAHIIKFNEINRKSTLNNKNGTSTNIFDSYSNISIDHEMFYYILAEISADVGCNDELQFRREVTEISRELRLSVRIDEESVDEVFEERVEIVDNQSKTKTFIRQCSRVLTQFKSMTSGFLSKLETITQDNNNQSVAVKNGLKNGVSNPTKQDVDQFNLKESIENESNKLRFNSKKAGRKLSVVIPKENSAPCSSSELNGSSILTPQTSRRLDNLAESLRNETLAKDVYLGGSCVVSTNWRDETVIPILEKHSLSYFVPAMNDYNRMFSAPPYTPASEPRFTFDKIPLGKSREACIKSDFKLNTSNPTDRADDRHSFNRDKGMLNNLLRKQERATYKHERSPVYGDDQPEKRPKYSRDESPDEDVEFRNKVPVESNSINNSRLSASDFYRIPENASPAPFRGMLDERQLEGSRVLFFGVTSDTRCLAPMVLAAHCIGLRPKSVVLCVQLLTQPEGLSQQAIKDYNRGRLYLIDLAQKKNVPVFDNLEEAALCVVEKLKNGDY